jgi:hypothetical protein
MCKQERYTKANGWEICKTTEPHDEPVFVAAVPKGVITDNSTTEATMKALEGVNGETESD